MEPKPRPQLPPRNPESLRWIKGFPPPRSQVVPAPVKITPKTYPADQKVWVNEKTGRVVPLGRIAGQGESPLWWKRVWVWGFCALGFYVFAQEPLGMMILSPAFVLVMWIGGSLPGWLSGPSRGSHNNGKSI